MSREKNPQIFIAKLSSQVRESDLEREFKTFGPIRNVELKRGYAFIEFEYYRDADDAIKEMDGRRFEGNRIVVQHSRGKRRDRERNDRDRNDRDRNDRDRNDRDRNDRDDRDRRYPRKSGPQPEDICFNCRNPGHWSNECREPPRARGKYVGRDRNNSVSRSRSRSDSRKNNRSRSRSISYSKDRRRTRRSESSRYGKSRSKSRSYSNRREKSENGHKSMDINDAQK